MSGGLTTGGAGPMAPEPDDDPLVRAALRHLPVPDHGPGFWDHLDARLVAVTTAPAEAGGAQGDTDDDDRDGPVLVPVTPAARRGRRRSTVVLAGTAAAAAVLVVAAAVTLAGRGPLADDGLDTAGPGVIGPDDAATDGDGRADAAGDGGVSTLAGPESYTGTTALPAEGSRGDGEPLTEAPLATSAEPASAPEVATAFVVAVSEGDVDAAWALLAPDSQVFWDGKERFAASATELAEGSYGSFRAARGLQVTTVVLSSTGDEEVGVVTLDGIVSLEGDERRRTLDLPYRFRAGGEGGSGTWLVDPWGGGRAQGPDAGGGPLVRFVAPAPPDPALLDLAELAADGTVVVEVPDWTTSATVLVDGVELAVVDPADATTVRVQPDAPFAPGVHRLTVAVHGSSGVTAASTLFRVP